MELSADGAEPKRSEMDVAVVGRDMRGVSDGNDERHLADYKTASPPPQSL